MESVDSIAELYREHTQHNEPTRAAERPRGAAVLFTTHALVVALADGRTLQWEHLTNHQIEPAAIAIASALDELR